MKMTRTLNNLLHKHAQNLLDNYQSVNEDICDREEIDDEIIDWIKRMHEEISESYFAIMKEFLNAKLNDRFPIRTIDAK